MTYVYRLVVTLPPGSEEPWRTGWCPPDWTPPLEDGDPEAYGERFSWPRWHLYLSMSGAEKRASLLRSYGATVTIERSEPVVWP